ncbi:MAG: J domain-containing protein [Deltaproteobacteria bacterium]|nr:J domain-containing protein [Deltaproteobacteria bacterium]
MVSHNVTSNTSAQRSQEVERILNASNYYECLDVSQDASPEEIKNRYRQLVRLVHPDLFQRDDEQNRATEALKIVNQAYEVLKLSQGSTCWL